MKDTRGYQAKRLVLSSVFRRYLQDHPVPGRFRNEWGMFLPNRDAVASSLGSHDSDAFSGILL